MHSEHRNRQIGQWNKEKGPGTHSHKHGDLIYNNCATAVLWEGRGEESLEKINGPGPIGGENELLGPSLVPHTKTQDGT